MDVWAEHAVSLQAGGPTIDPAIEPYTNHNGLHGKFSIAVDITQPLISKLSAQFKRAYVPTWRLRVEGTGSSAAIREFQLGLSYQRRGDKVRGKGTGGSNRVGYWPRPVN
ncbi:MAG: hypothetical protein R3B37_11190 [Nitrospira sp.]|nr:hypothetical protein [Nitrospira sp.]